MPTIPATIEVGEAFDINYETIDVAGQPGATDSPTTVESIDTDLLTVVQAGKKATVTGVGPGNGGLRLLGTADEDDFEADVSIKVVAPDQAISFDAHFPKNTIDVGETMTIEIVPKTWKNQAGILDAAMNVVSDDDDVATVVSVVGSQVTVHGEAGGHVFLTCTGASHGVALPSTAFGLTVRPLEPAVAFVITSVSPIRQVA